MPAGAFRIAAAVMTRTHRRRRAGEAPGAAREAKKSAALWDRRGWFVRAVVLLRENLDASKPRRNFRVSDVVWVIAGSRSGERDVTLTIGRRETCPDTEQPQDTPSYRGVSVSVRSGVSPDKSGLVRSMSGMSDDPYKLVPNPNDP